MIDKRDLVLLIDDDPMVRVLIKKAMEQRGFDVVDAGSGERGLVLFGERHPDIVLLDAMMPGLDGFGTCRAMRAQPEGEHVPVVILTGLDDDESIARAYDSGATDFYVKSAQMTLLAHRLRYLLRTARMRSDLARNRARLARAQRIARLGSWEWDLQKRTITATEESLKILDLVGGEEPMDEAGFVAVFYPEGVDAFRFEVLARLKAGRSHRIEGAVAAAGGVRNLEIEVEAERDAHGNITHVMGVVQDVTERHAAEEQVRRLSNFDGVTGLANRSLFRARLAESLSAARRDEEIAAVLVIGLDRFKVINQTLGQAAGDALLRDVAARLNGSVRDRDALGRGLKDGENSSVARLGGDEFTVLLRDLDDEGDALKVGERVLEALRKPYRIDGNECWVTASIGVAAYPRDGDAAELLLARADAAMRASKAAGGNAARVHEAKSGAPSVEKLKFESDLRKALERGELRLHWQPIVDANTRAIKGAEVLMRWQRDGKLVSPAEFIPLAEETGLIVPMGEWALETACAQLAKWRADGLPPLYVGVNLTSSHVQRRDVQRTVRQVLESSGLPPEMLSLEITESVLMDFVEPTLRGLHALRELGVRIAIDDFGTGYSSLSYLKRLPVTTLKIDRSFIIDIATDPDDAAIVSAIAGLAGTLSLNVVVEGVETEAQRAALVEHGVTTMQGYFFSRPLPIEAFDALLRQGGVLST